MKYQISNKFWNKLFTILHSDKELFNDIQTALHKMSFLEELDLISVVQINDTCSFDYKMVDGVITIFDLYFKE